MPVVLARRAGLVTALAAGLLTVLPATAHAAASPEPSGACPDASGVTVVVDLTDLGGEVEVGCAPAGTTGTEALQAAGFTDTRDAAGMICAIDSRPDPCPATFEGSYWSYWHAEPGGEWQFHEQGSDTTTPEAGDVEGWRYYDGSAGPTIEPPVPGAAAGEQVAAPQATEPAATAQDDATGTDDTGTEETAGTAAEEGATAEDDATAEPVEETSATDGTAPVGMLAIGAAAVLTLAVAIIVLARRGRTQRDEHDPGTPAARGGS